MISLTICKNYILFLTLKEKIKMNFRRIFMLAITSVILFSCGNGVNEKGESIDVSVQKLNEVSVDDDVNTIVIDVRTPEEVAEGTINGAATIDYHGDDFDAKIAQLDKTKTYYVYCKAGGRSSSAVGYMQDQGFENVHNVLGGYDDYKDAGFAE